MMEFEKHIYKYLVTIFSLAVRKPLPCSYISVSLGGTIVNFSQATLLTAWRGDDLIRHLPSFPVKAVNFIL